MNSSELLILVNAAGAFLFTMSVGYAERIIYSISSIYTILTRPFRANTLKELPCHGVRDARNVRSPLISWSVVSTSYDGFWMAEPHARSLVREPLPKE